MKRKKSEIQIERNKVYILTDSCMWEAQKQNGGRAPHAVEVVDVKTGQVRYIKSGSHIKFVGGEITEVLSQEQYNQMYEETNTENEGEEECRHEEQVG